MSMNVYWGDIHNHCAVSYGRGTTRRALANAREQLDFCSITGHAFWPDLPMDIVGQDEIIGMHLGGFGKCAYFWDELRQLIDKANDPGSFVTFPSYEWHSMQWGDYNCYAPNGDLALLNGEHPDDLIATQRERGCEAIVLPHHIGYARGHRGLNWDGFDGSRSPLIEIFSNHGSSEADDVAYEYHHSMGPRLGPSLARTGLMAGHRFGFYASTDSHDGYPGHYGHGRIGVLAEKLTRDAVWEAILNRRTIASTGARIAGEVTLGDAGIGGETRRRDAMPLDIQLAGTAAFDRVDLIHGTASDWTVEPLPLPARSGAYEPGRYKVRVETGWGRGSARTAWEVAATLEGGRVVGVEPCFRYSGYGNAEQEPSERITRRDERAVEWTCISQPNPAGMYGGTHFAAGGTQSVVLEIEAEAGAKLHVKANGEAVSAPLAELTRGSVGAPAGGFGSPALKVNRAIPQQQYTFRHQRNLEPASAEWGFVYVRAVQSDRQAAWLSPLWYVA